MSGTTEPGTTEPASTPPASGTRGWVKIVLALSLAMNLAVVGVVSGAWLRHGGPPRGEPRDMGLGPIGDAMTKEDRKALRDAFLAKYPDMKAGLATLRADFDALKAALRASPFDPAALEAAMGIIANRNADRLQTGQALIAAYLVSMTDAERAAFADRLDQALERGEKRSKPD